MRVGNYTVKFENKPSVYSYASVVSKKENFGPLSNFFDIINDDTSFGQNSWEKAESEMQRLALNKALEKAELSTIDLNYIFAGDLLNQCISSSFSHRDTNVPYFGVYGACSNMAETLTLATMMIDAKYAKYASAVTSSHFCTAERQYRFPLEYGGQRPQTSQWTVTGSGALVIGQNVLGKPYINYATTGKIVDFGIKDANNMGAAMAPAAYDTLNNFLNDTGTKIDDYDFIITGDLGNVGSGLLKKLFLKDGIDISRNYDDCGILIYNKEQDVHSGGSGCGCSASVLCSYILKSMEEKIFKNVLFLATGALLSPTSVNQGESIPCICHLVNIKID